MKPKLSFSFSTPSSSDVEALWHAHELVCKFYRDFLEFPLNEDVSPSSVALTFLLSKSHGAGIYAGFDLMADAILAMNQEVAADRAANPNAKMTPPSSLRAAINWAWAHRYQPEAMVAFEEAVLLLGRLWFPEETRGLQVTQEATMESPQEILAWLFAQSTAPSPTVTVQSLIASATYGLTITPELNMALSVLASRLDLLSEGDRNILSEAIATNAQAVLYELGRWIRWNEGGEDARQALVERACDAYGVDLDEPRDGRWPAVNPLVFDVARKLEPPPNGLHLPQPARPTG